MKNKGYDILVIWEKDFKHNKEKIIQECIEFIKNQKEYNGINGR